MLLVKEKLECCLSHNVLHVRGGGGTTGNMILITQILRIKRVEIPDCLKLQE